MRAYRSFLGLGVLAAACFAAISAVWPSHAADGGQVVVSPPHPPAPIPGKAVADGLDRSLSPQCRVPSAKLYTLAKLSSLKVALKGKRPIRVLSVGTSSAGLGTMSSYPVRLQTSLERSLPNVEIEVEARGLPGEVARGAAENLRSMIAEIEPDLVVWQVGTNDALARVEVEDFAEALREAVSWLNSHDIDVVLVDPMFTQSVADDEYYNEVVQRVREVAAEEGVPLVRRYEAMRFLSASKDPDAEEHMLGRHFRLNDLGLRCMAEHVTRAITLSLLQPDASSIGIVKPPVLSPAPRPVPEPQSLPQPQPSPQALPPSEDRTEPQDKRAPPLSDTAPMP